MKFGNPKFAQPVWSGTEILVHSALKIGSNSGPNPSTLLHPYAKTKNHPKTGNLGLSVRKYRHRWKPCAICLGITKLHRLCSKCRQWMAARARGKRYRWVSLSRMRPHKEMTP